MVSAASAVRVEPTRTRITLTLSGPPAALAWSISRWAMSRTAYFAEGTQAYFLSVQPNDGRDRAWLQENDPALFAILDSLYRP